MSSNDAWVERAQKPFFPNIRPAPVVLTRGEGCRVFDADGRSYLDLTSGIAVSALGHGHPALVEAITAQAANLLHSSNLYYNEPSIALAEKLVESSFADMVYFCNSGAEANEAAIKLARRHHYDRGDKARVRIVSFEKSFHGRTYGALTATAQPKYHEGFGPMPEGFDYVGHFDLEGLAKTVTNKTAAVIIEPLQGEGGVNVPPPGFLAEVRSICDRAGALLIFDEVQAGIGRTGHVFAYEHDGVAPDIMSLAKGIGGGLPLGAMVATGEIGEALAYGTHATTYGGNPVACAAGNVVLDTIRAEGFLEHVVAVGAVLEAGLNTIAESTGRFTTVRGRGLIWGAELAEEASFNAKDVVNACRARGVLTHLAGPRVVRLVPPLVLTEAEAREGLQVLEEALRSVS